ncbi:MAG TPA: hypothetical protein VN950_23820 [Terriglobales bacterium]|nr:hypothetical protein [Terriglobales bacterium]
MRNAVLLIVIPYVISILTRLSSVILDGATQKKAFLDAMNLYKPVSGAVLTPPAQSNILKHLSHALLRQSVVLTIVMYGFAAIIVIYERRDYGPGLEWLLFFLLLSVAFLWWVLACDVAYFSAEGWLKFSRGDWAQILLCIYDLSLATLSIRLILTAPHF